MNPLDIDSVRGCGKCVTLANDHVPSCGNPKAKVMLIGHAPFASDVEHFELFTGPAGEIVDFMLDEAALSRADVYLATLIKCRPPGRAGHPAELSHCWSTWLCEEINIVDPKVVVMFGEQVHNQVLQKRNKFEHGLVTKSKKRAYISSWKPGYSVRTDRIEDFVHIGRQIQELLDE